MEFCYPNPKDFNWTGQTEQWPCREVNWHHSRERLFHRYDQWSKALARQIFSGYYLDYADCSDFEHYASIGLLEAIDRYDPNIGAPFKSYAKKRIKGAILSHIFRYSETSSHAMWKHKNVVERVDSFQSISSNNADSSELVVDEIVDLALSFLLEKDTSNEYLLAGERYCSNELDNLHDRAWQFIEHLQDMSQQVLRMHYQQHKSFTEIADKLGLTIGRISQIHREAIKEIRRKLVWS